MHQEKLARHVDYVQAALTRRALLQPYVEPMWCSYMHDAGFANPHRRAHARRFYTRRDGLRSPPSKLNSWCCARLPLLRERHLPLLFAASMADEPTRDRHSHTQWSRLVSSPGPNLALDKRQNSSTHESCKVLAPVASMCRATGGRTEDLRKTATRRRDWQRIAWRHCVCLQETCLDELVITTAISSMQKKPWVMAPVSVTCRRGSVTGVL